MKVLITTSAFKDVFSPSELCETIQSAISKLDRDILIDKVPMCDGGEYTLETIEANLKNKITSIGNVTSPYNKCDREGLFIKLNENEAFISSSQQMRLYPHEQQYKDPFKLTAHGLGEVIKYVIDLGIKNITIGLGGTNTIDLGLSVFQALNGKLIPELKHPLKGKDICKIKEVQTKDFSDLIKDINFTFLGDAKAGIEDMHIPNKQKVANLNQVDAVLNYYKEQTPRILELFLSHTTLKDANLDYLGTAGGCAIPFVLSHSCTFKSGAHHFSDAFDLENKIKQSDIVITGEGKFDNSELGKTPGFISNLAKKYNKKVIYITGTVAEEFKSQFKSNRWENHNLGKNIEFYSLFPSYKDLNNLNYSEQVDYFKEVSEGIIKDILQDILN